MDIAVPAIVAIRCEVAAQPELPRPANSKQARQLNPKTYWCALMLLLVLKLRYRPRQAGRCPEEGASSCPAGTRQGLHSYEAGGIPTRRRPIEALRDVELHVMSSSSGSVAAER